MYWGAMAGHMGWGIIEEEGLKRNGKSCRLRWVNYLRPDLKRGQITPHEESIILELHARWGNRQEMSSVAFPQTVDEQNFLYTMLNVNNNVSAVQEPQAINEDILWDGLWNLDDFHGNGNGMNFNANCSNGKANTLHNLVVPFC
ncbi:hypothetical protein G4B88_026730 [Cannabis sativa]|uniref:HTH myb-type domain-containing protein n=1 Tax=Cannabis sativa TaxID=3483 RepID=A0A7J6F922_CANSA|nr:hypothetical protein G4B88_026730 [Cannabis sativa]